MSVMAFTTENSSVLVALYLHYCPKNASNVCIKTRVISTTKKKKRKPSQIQKKKKKENLFSQFLNLNIAFYFIYFFFFEYFGSTLSSCELWAL
jgi:hypothetical protein